LDWLEKDGQMTLNILPSDKIIVANKNKAKICFFKNNVCIRYLYMFITWCGGLILGFRQIISFVLPKLSLNLWCTCRQFHQHFSCAFLYECRFGSFFYVHTFILTKKKSCRNDIRMKKARLKRWWNWHLVEYVFK